MKMKLWIWHDDVRPPPDGDWSWARDNATARYLLERFDVERISLDHDLGGDHIDPSDPYSVFYRGSSEDDGMKLVEWMIENDKVPELVTIHSWNPDGARRMQSALNRAGYTATRKPFTVPQ